MDDRLLEELEGIYQRLEGALSSSVGNPCGTCRECCTARGISGHNVNSLEIELLARRTSPEQAEAFKRYAEREAGEDGEPVQPLCPYYETATSRCGAYDYRPFSCRIFGHFRAEGTDLPSPCVFRGRETVFPRRDYFTAVPLARELRHLTRRHSLFEEGVVRHGDVGPVRTEDLEFLDLDDPLDEAVMHQAKGDFPSALAALFRARERHGDASHVLYALGLMLEFAGRHAEARDVFITLVDRLPQVAALHYHAGYNQLAAGDGPGALPRLARAVELSPQHGLALGFMGYLKLMAGETEEGAGFLERALEVDPENGYFHLRLGLAWIGLGRRDDGLREIRRAADFDATRDKAREILGS